jgi:hypothetical protein
LLNIRCSESVICPFRPVSADSGGLFLQESNNGRFNENERYLYLYTITDMTERETICQYYIYWQHNNHLKNILYKINSENKYIIVYNKTSIFYLDIIIAISFFINKQTKNKNNDDATATTIACSSSSSYSTCSSSFFLLLLQDRSSK